MLAVLPGLRLPVARTAHLIAIAEASNRKRVEQALAQIQARGFARRRDLPALWRKLQR